MRQHPSWSCSRCGSSTLQAPCQTWGKTQKEKRHLCCISFWKQTTNMWHILHIIATYIYDQYLKTVARQWVRLALLELGVPFHTLDPLLVVVGINEFDLLGFREEVWFEIINVFNLPVASTVTWDMCAKGVLYVRWQVLCVLVLCDNLASNHCTAMYPFPWHFHSFPWKYVCGRSWCSGLRVQMQGGVLTNFPWAVPKPTICHGWLLVKLAGSNGLPWHFPHGMMGKSHPPTVAPRTCEWILSPLVRRCGLSKTLCWARNLSFIWHIYNLYQSMTDTF